MAFPPFDHPDGLKSVGLARMRVPPVPSRFNCESRSKNQKNGWEVSRLPVGTLPPVAIDGDAGTSRSEAAVGLTDQRRA
jgi:hypothetical protein